MTDFQTILRHKVSKKKRRYIDDNYDLDLSYINNRIIAMGFPSNDMESVYRNDRRTVKKFLDERHCDHYKIYNLCSEKKYDISFFENRVEEIGIKDHCPCTFSQILPFCQSAAFWLDSSPENIVVVHCKAGKGRTGMMVCFLLIYYFKMDFTEAMSLFDSKRTKNNAGVTIPSQIRYIFYFSRFMKGENPFEAVRLYAQKNNFDFTLFIKSVHIYNINLTKIHSAYFTIEHMKTEELRDKIFEKERELSKKGLDSQLSGLEESEMKKISTVELEKSTKSTEDIPLCAQLPSIYYSCNSKDRLIRYKERKDGDSVVHLFDANTELRVAPSSDVKLSFFHGKTEIFHVFFHTAFLRNTVSFNKFEVDGDQKFYKDLLHKKIRKDFKIEVHFLLMIPQN